MVTHSRLNEVIYSTFTSMKRWIRRKPFDNLSSMTEIYSLDSIGFSVVYDLFKNNDIRIGVDDRSYFNFQFSKSTFFNI